MIYIVAYPSMSVEATISLEISLLIIAVFESFLYVSLKPELGQHLCDHEV